MTIEQSVIKHYGHKKEAETILAQARQRAHDPAQLTVEDFATLDDMHIGGREATEYLLAALDLQDGMKVLDIGSGIGGAARYAARHFNVEVTGLDLTPEYKVVAETLSAAVGLENRLTFVAASALAMPFNDGMFDAAYMIHAGMNIADKQTLYKEVRRVLKPGGVFGIYDIMAGPNVAELLFPLPWADDLNTSFLVSPQEIVELLQQAGFEILKTESRRDFGQAAMAQLLAPESIEVRGEGFSPRAQNLLRNIEQDCCAPSQIICRGKA